jgi:hypothetical protein
MSTSQASDGRRGKSAEVCTHRSGRGGPLGVVCSRNMLCANLFRFGIGPAPATREPALRQEGR